MHPRELLIALRAFSVKTTALRGFAAGQANIHVDGGRARRRSEPREGKEQTVRAPQRRPLEPKAERRQRAVSSALS